MSYPWYRQGTITLTEDSATVDGTMTGWGNPAYVREGDALWVKIDGVLHPVEEIASVGEIVEEELVNENTKIQLRAPWTGSTIEDTDYAIIPQSVARVQVASLAYDISTFTRTVTAFISGTGEPSDELGENGWGYIDESVPAYYRKSDGEWGEPINLGGPIGPAGPSYVATSTTSVSIGTGTKNFTTQTGLAYLPGARVRTSSDANPTTHYMEGIVASYDDETGAMVVTSDRAIGSGSRADWSINLAGDVGSTGPQGASFAAASTTSLAIGTGTKAFTVASGLAYVAGQRVRASSAADLGNHMEGVVASYSSTTLTVTVDRVGGSGAFADWSIGLIGAVGATGRGYMATSATSRTIGTGLMSFTTQENLAYTVGARVRFSSAANPSTHYMEGLVDSYSGTAIAVNFDRFRGSGSRADWNINLIGDRGDAAYQASSATSTTIGTGSKAFTTQAGLAYLPGSRVRIASEAGVSNYMEGVVTAYSGTTLTVAVDKVGGSGTRTDWNISLAGQPGIDGLGAGTVNTALGGIELISAGSTAQLVDTAATPGTYGSSSAVPVLTIDQKGRITAAGSASIPDAVAMAIVFGA